MTTPNVGMNGVGPGQAPSNPTSGLTYEPPVSEATPDEAADFAKAQRDIISEIEEEYISSEAPEFTEEELTDPEDLGPESRETKPEEPEQPETESPEITKGLERIVAREVALQAKEAAFTAREARAAALERENADLRAKLPSADLYDKFNFSPTEALKSLGQDPETVVRLMIAEQLEAKGQEVPAALKDFVKDAKRERRIKELEYREAQRDKTQALQAEYTAVLLGAKEYVSGFTGDAKDAKVAALNKSMPVLTKIAKTSPDRVHREIMEEITRDAQARMATDPTGQPITYEEAARRAEARVAEYSAYFTMEPLASTTPGAKPAETGPKKVLPPQNKPPIKPLRPWEKKGDDEMARALAEAEREFHRVEAIHRRRA